MNSSIYNFQKREVENSREHPNLVFEECMKALQYFIDLGNSNNDYINLNNLSNKLFRKQFDTGDLKVLQELKDKYLPKVKIPVYS